MKNLCLLVWIGLGSMYTFPASAQVNINLSINHAPAWLPATQSRVDYYYIPGINAYYHVPRGQYIYMNDGHWIHSNGLPHLYRNYNFHSARKVAIHGYTQYLHHRKNNGSITYGDSYLNRGHQPARIHHNRHNFSRGPHGFEGRGNHERYNRGHGRRH